MNKLEASYTRALVRLFVVFQLGVAAFIVIERIRRGQWDFSYFVSINVLLLPFSAALCLFFVPRQIEWSSDGFRIQKRFGKHKKFSWQQLEAYGGSRGVFMLQFSGHSTFQIYPSAFNSSKWREFKKILSSNHGNKYTRFWFGSRAIGV